MSENFFCFFHHFLYEKLEKEKKRVIFIVVFDFLN